MSKTTKTAALAFSKASPQLIKKIEGVIADAKKHTLSVSRIYSAHNEVFGLKETPQTCPSCLRTRANKLAKWYEEGTKGKLKLVPTNGDTVTAAQIVAKYDVTLGDTEAEQLEAIGALINGGMVSEEEAAILRAKAIELQDAIAAEEPDEDEASAKAWEDYLKAKGLSGDSTDEELLAATKEFLADGSVVMSEEARARLTNFVTEEEAKSADAPQAEEGTTVLTLKEEGAQAIHFATEDKSAAVLGSKGTVKYADGSNVKTGKHLLADGTTLAVAVGGKAAIKE